MKVVIIEDDPQAAAQLKKHLDRLGEETQTAFETVYYRDAEVYLKNHAREHPEIIFLDIELPTIDGMEAARQLRKVEDPEYRVITLVVKPVGEMLLISEENYFSGRLEFQDGLPVTSKADKLEHGYGMKSIRMLTKKYGGGLRVKVKDNLFSLTLLFSLEK